MDETSKCVSDAVKYPAPSAPYAVAQQLYQEHLSNEGLAYLAAWRGGWMAWQQTHWVEIDAAALRQSIYAALSQARYWYETPRTAEWRPWNPDRHKMANVLEALAAVVHLSSDIDPPEWINTRRSAAQTGQLTAAPGIDFTETPASQVIACDNGVLDLSTRRLHDHTPALFNLVHVPFEYDPDALEPTIWLGFLASLWDDDEDSIALLQEYFGYVLSGRMDMQKLLMLVGPSRSGKGTIARVLTALVGGRRQVPGPTLAALNTNFGLSPLIGKPLAIISDARLGDNPAHVVVERLLSITGEDTLTIDRKFREPWTGKLPTRFVIMTNELPRFKDASGVIGNRFLTLRMTESFLGREDLTLARRLRPEYPMILNWALEGLDRLNGNDEFTVPASAREATTLIADLASPVSAFVRECCIREPAATVPIDTAWAEWRHWAEQGGHPPGSKITFGRDLRAVVPELVITQPRIDGKHVQCYGHLGLRKLY
jgi:putative DNA primase/helicase